MASQGFWASPRLQKHTNDSAVMSNLFISGHLQPHGYLFTALGGECGNGREVLEDFALGAVRVAQGDHFDYAFVLFDNALRGHCAGVQAMIVVEDVGADHQQKGIGKLGGMGDYCECRERILGDTRCSGADFPTILLVDVDEDERYLPRYSQW